MFARNLSVIALATAGVVGLSVSTTLAGETAGAVTVSISGSTAMRNFTISPDFTALTPGTSITINGLTYTASGTPVTAVQLGYGNASTADPYVAGPQTAANFLAYRVEWHEQGSVEGIAELVNDQIGTVPSVTGSTRNPVAPVGGIGNRVYINGNAFTGASTINGFTLGTSTYNTYANYNAAGSNLQGGQNRVQLGVSDVRSVQGFSVAGTAAFDRRAGQAGYGKGNPALQVSADANNLLGLGNGNVRRQLIDQSVLNMSTDKIDPKTGTNYAAGAWNAAGVANTDNKVVAITATAMAANPGTGLTDLNKSDAQWLQATGRLANGANFNVVTRDINSGTLNVAANNVGLDPSFAVGENDSGNGLGTVNESVIGPNIKFSGKSGGGNQLRPTVQNARMAIGHLGLADIKGSNAAGTAANPNAGANPLRALGYRNSVDNSAAAVQPSFDSITDGSYALFQNETYVTIKDPTSGAAAIAAYRSANPGSTLTDAQVWAGLSDAQTGIKGDNAGQDVADLRNNILGSTQAFPAQNGIRNPAAGLLANGFIPPNFMKVEKAGDGEAVTAKSYDTTNYNAVRSAYGTSFEVGAAAGVTTGTGALYGGDTTANIAITTANYLFGDFDGDGKRDFKDIKYATQGQATLNGVASNTDWKAGETNGTVKYNGFTKGDLIVKGDFNSDGNFDGRDLYEIARGASLADAGKTAAQLANPDNAQLTSVSGANVSDRYRTGVLYKNAALDYLNANASAAQKTQATANAANDPAGTNAFNKFDINRDGVVNRQDAAIVDGMVGRDYRNINDQLNSVVATNVNAAGTVFKGDPTADQTTPRKSISLVDVELTDDGAIDYANDFQSIRLNLGGSLLAGDADFNGQVDFNDFLALQTNFGQTGTKFSQGNFDFNTLTDFNDFLALQTNFGTGVPDGAITAAEYARVLSITAASQVPEPTALAVLTVGAAAMLRRRRQA